ncbi:LacI family DNA-binding transcriptional regulator [Nocardiopsis sp. NPDC055551]|uniref:LacI family DNA-binding transcriptional regulator n=1 Tax=Nocardiopsis sp. NPDC006832 TaxID=3157188 RepID=UPI0033F7A46E
MSGEVCGNDDPVERRPPTIYDVAEAAGVSPSTVSRAFSRPGRVNAETAERIRRVAHDLGYRVNPLARSLPVERTSMLALVVADATNPFHFDIIRGAQDAATKAGYTVLLTDTRESDLLERQALERTLPMVEGIVLASSRMSDSTIRVTAKQRPMVVLNRVVTGVPSVVTDISSGARRAIDHLRGLGHDRFTYVAGPEASWTDGMRWRELREAARGAGPKVRRIGPFPPTLEGGVEAGRALRREPTSAVIAYNDLLAIGLMGELLGHGHRVPEDFSVIGFDDIFGAQLVTPGLTTVAAPLYQIGSTAVGHLLAVLNGARPQTETPLVVPTSLIRRRSTGPHGADPVA